MMIGEQEHMNVSIEATPSLLACESSIILTLWHVLNCICIVLYCILSRIIVRKSVFSGIEPGTFWPPIRAFTHLIHSLWIYKLYD